MARILTQVLLDPLLRNIRMRCFDFVTVHSGYFIIFITRRFTAIS